MSDESSPATLPGTAEPAAGTRTGNPLVRYFARFDDGEVMRWAFRGLLIGAIGVLAVDLRDLAGENGLGIPGLPSVAAPAPILPPSVETTGPVPQSADPRRRITTDEAILRSPLSFSLRADNVLAVEGSIDVGAAARFAAEVEARGEYVRRIELNSPGGSLEDALAISSLVRERGYATGVAAGALCASSCPLILAGGVNRSVDESGSVGVHQFYAVGETVPAPGQAMADAQATTARISRHLSGMGVDPAIWLHALDTPPQALYYFTADEMERYRLTTPSSGLAAAVPPR